MRFSSLLALAPLVALGASCGGSDSKSDAASHDSHPVDTRPVDSHPVDTRPVDSHPVDTAPIDTAQPTVITVTCPTTPDQIVTTTQDDGMGMMAYTPEDSTIAVNGIVKFIMPPGDFHNVTPDAGNDPGLVVATNATACLKFTASGAFHFHCSIHGFTGSVTVTP